MTRYLLEVWPIGEDFEQKVVGVWFFTDEDGLKFWYSDLAEEESLGPRAAGWSRFFSGQHLPLDDPNILFGYAGGEGQMIDRLGVFETDEKWDTPEELIGLTPNAKLATAENPDHYSRAWWERHAWQKKKQQEKQNPASKRRELPEASHIRLKKNEGRAFTIVGGILPPRPGRKGQSSEDTFDEDEPCLFDDEDS